MIGIVMATALEANPFIAEMKLSLLEKTPFRIFGNGASLLTISGIGKVNAALATGYLAQKFNVKIFLNAGAAGALNAKYEIGDIYHVREVVEPDRPSLLTHRMRAKPADCLSGFPTAVLATQDVPVLNSVERERLSSIADLADMEGAAVLLAARKFRARCYIFKIISDTASHSDDATIIEHIRVHGQSFAQFIVERVLKALPKANENIFINNS
ncbi:MAG: hypothetical protein N2316_01655 [Spirochaetes bacterium]|nr:hypothetical protein [Spirochaetota bacterium]